MKEKPLALGILKDMERNLDWNRKHRNEKSKKMLLDAMSKTSNDRKLAGLKGEWEECLNVLGNDENREIFFRATGMKREFDDNIKEQRKFLNKKNWNKLQGLLRQEHRYIERAKSKLGGVVEGERQSNAARKGHGESYSGGGSHYGGGFPSIRTMGVIALIIILLIVAFVARESVFSLFWKFKNLFG